jgi:outer membrane receptor protein involved in Fe transport
VSGRVTDPSGAVILAAEVEIRNVETNLSVTVKTNQDGLYTIPSLRPGQYLINVGKPGFKSVTVTQVTLNVQDNVVRNFALQVGSVSETVTITAGGLNINTTDASVSTVVDRQFVENIPLNGRSFQSLILLTPGVTVATSNYNDYGQFSVNGQRASTNYFSVDGVSANFGIANFSGLATNTALGGAYPGLNAAGGTNSLVSVDALEEFKIQTSTYSAEFGRQPGGQVSLVTRSGTNQYHGTLFEYLRNDALDARDYFNREPDPKPALRQNQFGGTFGGPIFKDRTFFFFSYEGQRLRLPVSGTLYVPSTRLRSEAASAGSNVLPLLNAFPGPTGPELLDVNGDPTGWAPSHYGVSNPGSTDATSIRIDHNVNSRITLFGRFNESPSEGLIFPGRANDGPYGVQTTTRTRTVTVGATAVLSSEINNDFRFNYSRQFGGQNWRPTALAGSSPIDSNLLTNGHEGYGTVLFDFGGNVSYIYSGQNAGNYQRQLNIVDNISLAKSSHRLKFGVDYRRLSPTYLLGSSQYFFFESEPSVTNSTADLAYLVATGSAKPRFSNYSLYGQDTWKVSPRFTVDLGLRWELNPAPTEADGKMPAIVTGIAGNPPDVANAVLAPQGTPFYKTFYTAFAPRAGAAYQINSSRGHELVLRGGFGVYYDLGSAGATSGFPLTAYTILSGARFPLSDSDAVLPPITVPTSLPVSATLYTNDHNLKLPYTMQWNTALEQALGEHQTLSVSYVGSGGRRLLTSQYVNQPEGYYYGGTRPNPNFSDIVYTWNGPTSDYHSLQTQYQVRLKDGLQGIVNYTWSHAIDEDSSDIGNYVLTRGNADFDIRHNLSAAFTYKLPSLSATPILRDVLGNWTLDAIVHAQSGRPVDVNGGSVIVAGKVENLRPDVVPGQPLYVRDPSVPGGRRFNSAAFVAPPPDPNFPALPLRQGNFGRNVLHELPLSQIDFALGHNFSLSERFRLQFKGEFFNILNHPMFAIDRYAGANFTVPGAFGVPTQTLRNGLSTAGVSGLSSLYQLGGPRSIQVSLRLTF